MLEWRPQLKQEL